MTLEGTLNKNISSSFFLFWFLFSLSNTIYSVPSNCTRFPLLLILPPPLVPLPPSSLWVTNEKISFYLSPRISSGRLNGKWLSFQPQQDDSNTPLPRPSLPLPLLAPTATFHHRPCPFSPSLLHTPSLLFYYYSLLPLTPSSIYHTHPPPFFHVSYSIPSTLLRLHFLPGFLPSLSATIHCICFFLPFFLLPYSPRL